MKIALIGSGIAGLAVAHTLRGRADITLFEAGDYFGGHTHTVDVTLPDQQGRPVTHGVDTGFLVFNERTYPQLIALFAELGIPTAKADMSFSVQTPQVQWSGASLNSVFSQRRNLLRPRFWGMLADILRFNRQCTALAQHTDSAALLEPLGDYLQRENFGPAFCNDYLLPMLGCIWSCPTDQMLQFPLATMVRFCHNHGLLQVNNRPQWWTVDGGARQYVARIVASIGDARLRCPVQRVVRHAHGVDVHSPRGIEHFDKVVFACHSDQALALLADPTPLEARTLGAIRYQPNVAVLHTDTRHLPQQRRAWAAWNYERSAAETPRVCLHYWLNVLQPLPFAQPVVVSLNPLRPIDPQAEIARFDYAHPVFDAAAIAAQAHVAALQGQQHSYFCGAWAGYGFHEDGLKSGLAVARCLQEVLPA